MNFLLANGMTRENQKLLGVTCSTRHLSCSGFTSIIEFALQILERNPYLLPKRPSSSINLLVSAKIHKELILHFEGRKQYQISLKMLEMVKPCWFSNTSKYQFHCLTLIFFRMTRFLEFMSIFLNRLRIIKVLSVLQSLTKNVKHKHVLNKNIRIIQIKIFLSHYNK